MKNIINNLEKDLKKELEKKYEGKQESSFIDFFDDVLKIYREHDKNDSLTLKEYKNLFYEYLNNISMIEDFQGSTINKYFYSK